MKKLFFAAMLLLSFCTYSQNYQLATGDQVKLRALSADMDIVTSDKTGIYFTEQRWTNRAKLYKFDNNYNPIYDRYYKKEITGTFFQSIQPIDEEIVMFSKDYSRKEKKFTLFAQKITKTNGDIVGEPKEVGSFQLESKRDDFDIKFTSIAKGKKILYVANVSNDDRVSIVATVIGSSLQKETNATINFRFTPKQFSVEDVFYTSNDKILVLGKESEETQVGTRKKKRWVFKQYILSIFSKNGKKEKEILMNADQRFAISGKLIEQLDGTVALAGFYSNDSKKKDLNGFFLTKIDTDKNELLLSSYKEINSSMIGQNYTEDADDSDEDEKKSKKQDKKDDDENDEIPNDYLLKSVLINPIDNSLVITAEISQLKRYFTTTGTGSMQKSSLVYQYTNKDILLIYLSADGQIKWINTIPKNQEEKYDDNAIYYSKNEDYFSGKTAHPYYSSFASLIHKDKLIILTNDHQNNTTNPGYGDRVKRITTTAFKRRSNLYGISVDLATGNMKRKLIHENSPDGIMMPRIAYINGTTILIPSLRIKNFAKNEFRMNQLTIK